MKLTFSAARRRNEQLMVRVYNGLQIVALSITAGLTLALILHNLFKG